MREESPPILDYQPPLRPTEPPRVYICGSRNHLIRRQRIAVAFARVLALAVLTLMFYVMYTIVWGILTFRRD